MIATLILNGWTCSIFGRRSPCSRIIIAVLRGYLAESNARIVPLSRLYTMSARRYAVIRRVVHPGSNIHEVLFRYSVRDAISFGQNTSSRDLVSISQKVRYWGNHTTCKYPVRRRSLNTVPKQRHWVDKCDSLEGCLISTPWVVDSKAKRKPCWPSTMNASARTMFVSLISWGDRFSIPPETK